MSHFYRHYIILRALEEKKFVRTANNLSKHIFRLIMQKQNYELCSRHVSEESYKLFFSVKASPAIMTAADIRLLLVFTIVLHEKSKTNHI